MEKLFNLSLLTKRAEEALIECLDYIVEHRLYSTWTKKLSGWQEQWNQSKFTGLYATCSALNLLVHYKDKYPEAIANAIEEIGYIFDGSIDYSDSEDDSLDEKKRKGRCRLLLEQNLHTTLKAVYFLKSYRALTENGLSLPDNCHTGDIIESVYGQIDSTYNADTGLFSPALDNTEDVSILTTAQAFVVMQDRWGTDSERTAKTKELLLGSIRRYSDHRASKSATNFTKFDIYKTKSEFVAALSALSNTIRLLDEGEIETVAKAFFSSMSDNDIRTGFTIKDSFSVPNTTIARDTYMADSRVLYLNAAILLIKNGVIPLNSIEYFLDDIVEIVDTSLDKKQYLSWDSSPSFSHNIRGLTVLRAVVDLLKNVDDKYTVCDVSPSIKGETFRAVSPMSVVLFMSFSKKKTVSVQETIRQVLNYVGFDVWWATNDPYDAFVVDNILERLAGAQFAIVDCSERSPNVMYEAGWAHGLGKPTLLCGPCDDVFPYESADLFDKCCFEPDGNVNPPPYRDLQEGIARFIIKNADDFCLTGAQKRKVIKKAEAFIEVYCT